MVKRIMNIIGFMIIFEGIVLLCYPSFSSYINDKLAYKEISSYENKVDKCNENEIQQILETAYAYNQSLPGGYPADPFTSSNITNLAGTQFESFSLLQDGAMLGYVEIPSIDVYLPLYYGTSDTVLKEGLGVVENSSLPVGGSGTHSVISGHTGMASRKLFTDLDLMKKEDIFFVHVLNQNFAYQVNQIKVVLPTDSEDLLIEEDKDYVTLLTCTPFGINDHRLLVRGERIEYDFSVNEEAKITPEATMNKYFWAIVLSVVFLFSLILLFVKKKRRRHIDKVEQEER